MSDKLLIIADHYPMAIQHARELGIPGHPGEHWVYIYEPCRLTMAHRDGRYTVRTVEGLTSKQLDLINDLRRRGYTEVYQ